MKIAKPRARSSVNDVGEAARYGIRNDAKTEPDCARQSAPAKDIIGGQY